MTMALTFLMSICLISNVAVASYKDPKKTFFEFDENLDIDEPADNSHVLSQKYETCLDEKNNLCKYLKHLLRLITESADRQADKQTLTFELSLNLAQLDEIDNMLHSPKCNHALPAIFAGLTPRPNWKRILYDETAAFIYENKTILGLCTFSLLVFLLLMWWIQLSKSYITACTKLLILAFIVSVVITYYRNQQEILVKKFVKLRGGIPLKCRPDDVRWYHYLWHRITGSLSVMPDECEEYFKAEMVDSIMEYTILEAVVETFTKTIFTALPIIFEYVTKSFLKVFQLLPMYLWGPMCVVIIVFVFFQTLLQQKYRFRHFLLGTLEPADVNQPMLQAGGNAASVTNVTNSPMLGNGGSYSVQATGDNITLSVKPGGILIQHGTTHNGVEELSVAEVQQKSDSKASGDNIRVDSEKTDRVLTKPGTSASPVKESIACGVRKRLSHLESECNVQTNAIN